MINCNTSPLIVLNLNIYQSVSEKESFLAFQTEKSIKRYPHVVFLCAYMLCFPQRFINEISCVLNGARNLINH